MAQPKIYVTRRVHAGAVEMMREKARVEMWDEDSLPVPREVLLENAADADALFTMLSDRIDAEVIDAGGGLKVIGNYAVGYDNIDVKHAASRGIGITHTPDALTETTADLAFSLLMAAARRIVEADRYVRAGKWKGWAPNLLLGRDVFGATLGIVGFGRIGQAVARRAKGFNMRALYYSRTRKVEAEQSTGAEFTDLGTLLKESDFVSLHVPLTDETRRLIGEREFGLMKPSCILINTSRGAAVDEKALTDALRNGVIAGAGLDVYEREPLPDDNILNTLDNVALAPHIGSASVETRARMAEMVARDILLSLEGKSPRHPVPA